MLAWCAMGVRGAWSVSLSEAVPQALTLSPTVQAADKQRQITEQQTRQALAGYLPTVDYYASMGNEKTDSPSTRALGGGAVSLPHRETRTSVSQMLFDGFNVSSGVKKARATQQAADWSYQLAIQTVTMDAVEQYLEVQKQRELLHKIKQFASVQADFLAKIQEWYEGGAGTVAEVWQTESRLALTRSSMATVASQLSTAQDEFARLFGFAADHLEPVASVSTRLPHSLEQALEQAAQRHPSLLEAHATLAATEAARTAAQAGLWPTLHLALENSRTNNSSGFDGETQSTATMLRLNYNLFRGGTDLARSLEFNRRQEQAQAQAEQVRQNVQKNVEKSWRTIMELRQRLVSLQQHETVSRQVADAYHEQFIADQRSLLDVLNAENELYTAQSNRASGHYALLVEEYRLLANMGILELAAPAATRAAQADTRLTLQEAQLTPATPVTLRANPQANGAIVRELPKQTPLRILQTRHDWMQVIDSAGNQGWITGVTTPSGQLQSGLFSFPAETAPPPPDQTRSAGQEDSRPDHH
ncbi:MAG: TolC family outer membrane protein [Magnetococcus sp. DMHC-8]